MLWDIYHVTFVRLYVLLSQDDTFWGELWDITLFAGQWFGYMLVYILTLSYVIRFVISFFDSTHSIANLLYGKQWAEDQKRKRGQKVQENDQLTLETTCRIARRLNVFKKKNPTVRQKEYLSLAQKLNWQVLSSLHKHRNTMNWSTLVTEPDRGSWDRAPTDFEKVWKKKREEMGPLHGFGLVVWVSNNYAHSEEKVGKGLFTDSAAVDEYLTTRFPWLAELLHSFKCKHLDPTQDWRQWMWRHCVTLAKNLARFVLFLVWALVVLFAIGYNILRYKK